MVLAAGVGSRMRPLTDTAPKPLLEVAGQPLIARILDPLEAAGVRRLVINVHHLAEAVEAYADTLRDRFEVVISDERGARLETGGALAKARPLLGDDPVWVVNTDAFWAGGDPAPLLEMAAAFAAGTSDIHLLLARRSRALGFDGPGDFTQRPDGRLDWRGGAPSAPLAYAGVRLIRPALYDGHEAERFSALDVWRPVQSRGRLTGTVLEPFWLHVGTPHALADAEMWSRCHGL